MDAALTNLRRARLDRGLTQAQLARKSGLSQSTIAFLERRPHADPPWSTVLRLVKVLGCPPGDLFGRPTRNGRGRNSRRPL